MILYLPQKGSLLCDKNPKRAAFGVERDRVCTGPPNQSYWDMWMWAYCIHSERKGVQSRP